jgi:hypothetical protein
MVAFALVRASSLRKQAVPSIRPKLVKMQDASLKPRGTSLKLQATSVKLHNILPLIKFYKVKGEGLNCTGKLEDLTTEELENRMKQIIDDYSPILEDVPFEEIKDQVQSKSKTKKESEPSSESSLSSLHKKSGKQNVH